MSNDRPKRPLYFVQNQRTKNFLNIYPAIIKKKGIRSDLEMCKTVFPDLSSTQLSSARSGLRNIPDHILRRFIDYFKIDENLIFGNPDQGGRQAKNTITFDDGTTKKIVKRIDEEGLTILILK